MVKRDLDARDRIIQAAMSILNEEKEADKVTVRAIADRAKVGIGLINYHFKSKEKLLIEAIGETMGDLAINWLQGNGNLEPVQRLKAMLQELTDFGVKYYSHMKISVSYEILNGSFQTPLFLLPILRDIYGETKDEIQLRIIALQTLTTLQVASLQPSAFKMYAGIDLFDISQRHKFIETLVDNLINKGDV